MSEAIEDVNDTPLTMEPDDEIVGVIDESTVDAIREQLEGEDEPEGQSITVTEMTPEQIAAGLDRLSGGVATAQDVENAARAEEGLPPIEPELPLDFGPFNPDAALKSIFDKEADVSRLKAISDRKRSEANDASRDYKDGRHFLRGCMTNLVLEFFGRDPLVAYTLVFALCCTIAGVVIAGRAAWQDRRHRQQDAREAERRRELSAVMAVTHDLSKKGPTGWRKSA